MLEICSNAVTKMRRDHEQYLRKNNLYIIQLRRMIDFL